MSIKNSNDTIGNRARDLPTCSAVPQPTALPRAPGNKVSLSNLSLSNYGKRRMHGDGYNSRIVLCALTLTAS